MIYAEFALVAWAAKKLGRPVKWIIERHESFLSDYQARDLAVEAELALDAKGNFLAMRGSNLGNLGGHTTNFAMVQKGVQIMSSIYRMPAAHFRARATLVQHLADAALSQRRPAGSDLRHGAADRSRRARLRLRPRRDPPAQSRDREGNAVQKSVRHGIRQRRLHRRHGYWRSSSATGPASSAAAPKPKSAANIAASASAIMSIPQPACRARKPRSPSSRRASSNSSSASPRKARATRRASRN